MVNKTGKKFTVTARVVNIMSVDIFEDTMAQALEHAKTLDIDDFDGVDDSSLEITSVDDSSLEITGINNENHYLTN